MLQDSAPSGTTAQFLATLADLSPVVLGIAVVGVLVVVLVALYAFRNHALKLIWKSTRLDIFPVHPPRLELWDLSEMTSVKETPDEPWSEGLEERWK